MPRRPAERAVLDGGSTVELTGFTIRLPDGWVRKQDAIVALHALPSGARLYPNLKVAVVNLPKGATARDVAAKSKEVYANAWSVEDEGAAAVGGAPAYRMVLVQDVVTKSKQVKYFVAAGDKALVVSGQSEPDEFDRHLAVFEAMVQSLEVRTP
jgi:hypothetical protein